MKKLGKFIKSNTKLFIGFILGALIFGSVGAVVAGTVASSEITYTNNGQTTVEGAINDLYGKADNLSNYSNVDINYWDDNWNNNDYASNEVPNRVYTSNDMNYMVFIKTIYKDGNPFKHLVCAKPDSSSKMFCLANDYWESIVGSNEETESNGNRVKNSLKEDMEAALGNIITSCTSSATYVQCYIANTELNTNFSCFTSRLGYSGCDYEDGGDYPSCYVSSDGTAYCEH